MFTMSYGNVEAIWTSDSEAISGYCCQNLEIIFTHWLTDWLSKVDHVDNIDIVDNVDNVFNVGDDQANSAKKYLWDRLLGPPSCADWLPSGLSRAMIKAVPRILTKSFTFVLDHVEGEAVDDITPANCLLTSDLWSQKHWKAYSERWKGAEHVDSKVNIWKPDKNRNLFWCLLLWETCSLDVSQINRGETPLHFILNSVLR